LLSRIVKGVESVEKFLLGILLAHEGLDVVDQKAIEIPVLFPEILHFVETDGVDELIDEPLRSDVKNLRAGVVLTNGVARGVQNMGFPQADAPVKKKRVVGPSGILGHGHGGGLGESVGRPHHEALKGVFGVKLLAREVIFGFRRGDGFGPDFLPLQNRLDF